MPGMDGPQLAAELRAIRPEVPIIMTSGYIRPEDVEVAERLRVNQLVYKPNTMKSWVSSYPRRSSYCARVAQVTIGISRRSAT